jgi:hypothetical protein
MEICENLSKSVSHKMLIANDELRPMTYRL